jgi:hypothetical protein
VRIALLDGRQDARDLIHVAEHNRWYEPRQGDARPRPPKQSCIDSDLPRRSNPAHLKSCPDPRAPSSRPSPGSADEEHEICPGKGALAKRIAIGNDGSRPRVQ